VAEGGGFPIGTVPQPGGREHVSTWKNYGWLGSSAPPSPPAWQKKQWIAKNVPWFTEAMWEDRTTRESLLDAAFLVWRDLKLSDPKSDLSRKTKRTPEGREYLRVLAAARGASGSTQPPDLDPDQRDPNNPAQMTTRERLIELVKILAEQYRNAQAEREQQRAARRQMKAQLEAAYGGGFQQPAPAGGGSVMPFPRISSGFGFSPALGGGNFGSSLLDMLPALTSAASPLISRLFEQDADERPDMLERLGLATGLEGAVEREATFWLPSAAGVRANREITARNPVSGRSGTWRYMGAPVLYSGDLATCKRVSKIAGRVGRFSRRGSLPRRRRSR